MREPEPSPIGDTLGMVQLDPARIAEALQLSNEAQWNQVAADWAWMLQNGDSFGVVTAQDPLVASGLTVNFPGGGFGWISMILVTAEYRRRRLATNLMQYCIEALQRFGLVAALDASPQGRQVYLPLGFADSRTMTRLRGTVRTSPMASRAPVRAITMVDLPVVAAYDSAAAGTERHGLLSHLFARLPGGAFVSEWEGTVRSYVLARDGRTCAQVGPLVADDDDAALALLQQACAAIRGPVCQDLGDQHPAPQQWLRDQGFADITTFQCEFQRKAARYSDLIPATR